MHHQVINLTGNKYGRLTVVEYTGTKMRKALWKCICECGNTTYVRSHKLKDGNTRSCGCLRTELLLSYTPDRGKTHGESDTRLYRTWSAMKQRCFNPNLPIYKYYGGRGITVCDEWKDDFVAFRDWALANGYDDTLTIDRIDNDGDYCPQNCQFLTRSENAAKQRLDREAA